MEKEQKKDNTPILIGVFGVIAGAALVFLIIQYQNYRKISKAIENGLIQLPKIYEIEKLLQEKQAEIPKNNVALEDIPAPESLINFFSSQIFSDSVLEPFKPGHKFQILSSNKISETEREENIRIQFNKINLFALVKYIFTAERNYPFIKLKQIDIKAPSRQNGDEWDVSLVLSYRRLTKA